RQPIRTKPRFRPRLEALETRLAPAAAPLTSGHYDNLLSGWNSNETVLTQSNVNDASFGKLFSYSIDGYAYAQPLYVPNLTTAGAAHNVDFVATEHDGVYASAADNPRPGPGGNGLYWQRNFTIPAAGIAPVPAPADDKTSDVVPEVGIT